MGLMLSSFPSVSLLGIGISNLSLLPEFKRLRCRISIRDRRPAACFQDQIPAWEADGIVCHFGEEYLEDLCESVLFRSPGIRPDLPELVEAQKHGAILCSDIDYFFAHCSAPIYAVTGSDGKTTTASLLAALSAHLCPTYLGGNIGTPLCNYLYRAGEHDAVVAELSSFQLMTMRTSPTVAVVTNLSPNHLDYHLDFSEYRLAKEQIFLHPECRVAVLNYGNPYTREMASRLPHHVECRFFGYGDGAHLCVCCHDGMIFCRGIPLIKVADLCIPGRHNVENFMAACAALADRITPSIAYEVAQSFFGVPHRLELVRTLRSVRYYNSSIDSTPTRTLAALSALESDAGRIRIILGGYDKNLSFAPLGKALARSAKEVILIGATADKIESALTADPDFTASGIPILRCRDLDNAVFHCASVSKCGEVVLLSPACASFDSFKNFEERGMAFTKAVRALL